MLDFNRANLSEQPLNQRLNELIEAAEPPSKNYRQYLGASSIGSECLRKGAADWSLLIRSFQGNERHLREGALLRRRYRKHLIAIGFRFAPVDRLGFETAEGLFRGHADGIITAGPEVPDLIYPCVWEHKCLGVKASRRSSATDLSGLYTVYAGQVAIYQAYSTSLNRRCLPSLTLTPANACTSPCRSTPSSRKRLAIALWP